MDLEIRRLKSSIVNLLNNTNLPIEVKRLLLAEIVSEVSIKANEVVSQELANEKENTNANAESEVTESGN